MDTHTFLWFILNDPRLSADALNCITDPLNRVLVSPSSCWKIAIKISTGKYALTEPFETFLESQIKTNSFELLPIQIAHAARVAVLPYHHRDPFDRMLIAQALTEGVPIISADKAFDAYGVTRIW